MREALFGDTDKYDEQQLRTVDKLLEGHLQQGGQGGGRWQQGDGENLNMQKAINTLRLLQRVAEGYNTALPTTRMDQYRYDYLVERYTEMLSGYGLARENVAWFAADGEVSLVELFMMEMNAEGGSVDPRQIPYLANRMHQYTYGTEYLTDMLTVVGLLNAYEDELSAAHGEAEAIVRNLLGHDDAILGPGDFDDDPNTLNRGALVRQRNIQNLLLEPNEVIAPILRTWAEAIVNWRESGEGISGLEAYTRWGADNTGYVLIPSNYEELGISFEDALPRSHELVRGEDELNAILEASRNANLGEPWWVQTPNGYAIFYNEPQYLNRHR